VGVLWRVVLPERVDQPVDGDGLVRLQEECGEERALLRAAQFERLPVGDDLQRAEDPKLQPSCRVRRAATLTPPAAA
jgi:hypothetical protein